MNMLQRAKPRSVILADAETLTAAESQRLEWPTEPPQLGETADDEPRTDLDGLRVTIPGSPAIYLIDGGYRRWVPNPGTYNDLFADWNGIQSSSDFAAVPIGTPIASGSNVAQATGQPAIYFIDGSAKRHIVNPGVMTYWAFGVPRQVEESVLDAMPDGPLIENSMACFTATSTPQPQGASLSLIGSADAISGFDEYEINIPEGCPALCISMVAPLTGAQPVNTSFVLTAADGAVYRYSSGIDDDYIGESNATGLVNFYQETPTPGAWTLAVTAFTAEAFWAEVLLMAQAEGEAAYQTVLDDFTDNAPMVRDALQSILGDDTSPEDFEAHRAEFRASGSLGGGWWACWTCKAVIIVVAVVVIALVIGTIPESAPVVAALVRCAAALRVVLSVGAAATILNGLVAAGIPHLLEALCHAIGICD